MRYLALAEVVDLHGSITKVTGGASGIRNLGALESAIAQPKTTFEMNDLYPSLVEKAAVLCFAIVQGHPFMDGNKRTKASNGLRLSGRAFQRPASAAC